jgi:ATP phosphoribosyltransferase regulatory subunit HisZ
MYWTLTLLATLFSPVTGILSALQCSSLEALSDLLGPDGSQALSDLQALWKLAEGYGYSDWLVFDASVVRGLAYYTGERWGAQMDGLDISWWARAAATGRTAPGRRPMWLEGCVHSRPTHIQTSHTPQFLTQVLDAWVVPLAVSLKLTVCLGVPAAGIVFEGFDRAGQLRAICGGGRYDKLLGTFGGEDQPCAGFGFGDAVIVELLKDKGLLVTPQQQVRTGLWRILACLPIYLVPY